MANKHTNAALVEIGPLMTAEEADEIGRHFKGDDIISADHICKRRTWCTRPEHPPETPCLEKPRRGMERTDFGPRRAVKVGWR